MPLTLLCSKGCGEAITVDDDTLAEMQKSNRPLDVHHQVCPNEEQAPVRRFRTKFIVTEVTREGDDETEEHIAMIGADVEAPSFMAALPKIQQDLNDKWQQVLGMAPFVDADQSAASDTPSDQQG